MSYGANRYEEGLQWLRSCSLLVLSDNDKGLDLGELRVSFSTKKGDTQTPNSAEIQVYNLSEATISRMRREFTRVVLLAGYQTNLGVIFSGNIRSTRVGKGNGTDTYVEISAADGDNAYNFATVNTTLAAGSTPLDRVNVCHQSFSEKDVELGYIPELKGEKLPRGKVMYGMCRYFMRSEAKNTNCSWSFQDGKMQILKNFGYLPGEAVLLTHETGLIGTPEQTNEGIRVSCLLNPKLRVGGRIRLDNKSIQEAKTDLKAAAQDSPKINTDGYYRILKVEFNGDTRGNNWYADIICVGLDDTSNLPLDMME